jgi:hypothetical protein
VVNDPDLVVRVDTDRDLIEGGVVGNAVEDPARRGESTFVMLVIDSAPTYSAAAY